MLTFILLFTFIGVPLIFLFAKRSGSPSDGWVQDTPYTSSSRHEGGCQPTQAVEDCGSGNDSSGDSGSECSSDSGGSGSGD